LQRRSFFFLFLVLLFLGNLTALRIEAQSAGTDSNAPTEFKDALIVAIDGDAANLSIRDCSDATKVCGISPLIAIRVDTPALRATLKPFKVGDRVRLKVTYSKAPAKTGGAPKPDTASPDKPHAQTAQPQETNSANSNPQGTASPPDNGNAPTAAVLTDCLGAYSESLGRWHRLIILLLTALALLAVATIVTKGRPLVFVVGMDNRYSNSKVQVALWFWIVLSTYLAAWVFRIQTAGWDFAGMVNIPQNLLLLSGLSALTYGGAKTITTSKADSVGPAAKAAADALTKVALDAQTKLADAKMALTKKPDDPALAKGVTDAKDEFNALPKMLTGTKTQATDADKKFFSNLVQNDAGGFDFGDFQMLVVTVIAVATYLILFFHFFDHVSFTKAITLPDVDTTILSIVGLGQGAYLAKKAGGDVGTS
jgi:hypothetical protein